MSKIATIGPCGSHAWQAAKLFAPEAELLVFPQLAGVLSALDTGQVEQALVPVFNTREGYSRDFFHRLLPLRRHFWVDNLLLPIHLSLAAIDQESPISTMLGRATMLRQSEEYIAEKFPAVDLLAVHDIDKAIDRMIAEGRKDVGVIEAEAVLAAKGLVLREREISPYNKTRYAVLADKLPASSGYDASAVFTTPLKDRVGLLHDILGQFARRGINILDINSETDVKTQKLSFFIEMEGHVDDPGIREALSLIENEVIREAGSLQILGSYPRIDMRTKRIKRCGFIGSGAMSQWFARRLEGEGYEVLLSGRNSELRPEAMIEQVDLLAICVPISATAATVEQYGPLLKENQALVLLAGEAEISLDAALKHTASGVEVMLVHNLWGPKAETMKNKNVSLVRTERSGVLCREFEAFLYKHGATISFDSTTRHNLLMGVVQKLPSATAIALAMTLHQHALPMGEIERHSTLTSAYSMLAMARVHFQNPRTYAEILACPGEGRTILDDFAGNLAKVLAMADNGKIEELCALVEKNKEFLGDDFLAPTMNKALAVDSYLSASI